MRRTDKDQRQVGIGRYSGGQQNPLNIQVLGKVARPPTVGAEMSGGGIEEVTPYQRPPVRDTLVLEPGAVKVGQDFARVGSVAVRQVIQVDRGDTQEMVAKCPGGYAVFELEINLTLINEDAGDQHVHIPWYDVVRTCQIYTDGLLTTKYEHGMAIPYVIPALESAYGQMHMYDNNQMEYSQAEDIVIPAMTTETISRRLPIIVPWKCLEQAHIKINTHALERITLGDIGNCTYDEAESSIYLSEYTIYGKMPYPNLYVFGMYKPNANKINVRGNHLVMAFDDGTGIWKQRQEIVGMVNVTAGREYWPEQLIDRHTDLMDEMYEVHHPATGIFAGPPPILIKDGYKDTLAIFGFWEPTDLELALTEVMNVTALAISRNVVNETSLFDREQYDVYEEGENDQNDIGTGEGLELM